MQTALLAVNVKKLSEDELIALEHALGAFRAAYDEWQSGELSRYWIDRIYAKLECLCLDAGMDDEADAVAFAEREIAA